ncbi:MAG: hypothetical protein N2327_04405 [Caldimicrobium sp.]|nr:hypothetical protein [Caldimicrobium sp.]MCX7873655.1 hypothetical protein [Caldimicrobium sp.]MDW8094346.1 hypothetical protein [Caldimicrobium sp.]
MEKISQHNGAYLFRFNTLVEKELFKGAIKAFPGIVDISDKDGVKTLKIRTIPGSLGDTLLRDFQCRKKIKFDRQDLNYYLQLLLKHPLLKLCLSIWLLGARVGILSFLICSQIIMPLIKKSH